MFKDEIKVRVRYSETDKMGYCYYGNYAAYFEVARVELMRELGFSYKKMEDEGIMLPVADFHIRYIKPAFYDDLLIIKTQVSKKPLSKIEFTYETFNEAGDLLNTAETILVFFDIEKKKPCRAPADFIAKASEYFED